MPEDGFGLADEVAPVACFAQRVGADDAHRALRQAIDHLCEQAQAIEPALHGFGAELAILVDTGGQLNLVADALENADFTAIGLGQDHVEAVRAQVDGGDQREMFGRS